MDLWRELEVGDRVRLVEIPREFLRAGYHIFPETIWVYKKLLARGRPLRICKVDEWGAPWIHCKFRRRNGKWDYHWLALNHDGIVRVKPRR